MLVMPTLTKGRSSRGLIRFKHWKTLGSSGIKWLHIHVHNMLEGLEIKSVNGESIWSGGPAGKNLNFSQREGWVTKNLEMLREVARKPQRFVEELGLNERKSGKRTDFQRLSALIELDRVWSEYEENGSDWDRVKSGQPIYLDASCNGYQHVSALLRDEELAHLTNLLESKVGPQDLYAAVAESGERRKSKIRKFLKN